MLELAELMISGSVVISVAAMGIMGILGVLMMISRDLDRLVGIMEGEEEEAPEKAPEGTNWEDETSEKKGLQ